MTPIINTRHMLVCADTTNGYEEENYVFIKFLCYIYSPISATIAHTPRPLLVLVVCIILYAIALA